MAQGTRSSFLDIITQAPEDLRMRLIDLLDSIVFKDELKDLEDRVAALESP